MVSRTHFLSLRLQSHLEPAKSGVHEVNGDPLATGLGGTGAKTGVSDSLGSGGGGTAKGTAPATLSARLMGATPRPGALCSERGLEALQHHTSQKAPQEVPGHTPNWVLCQESPWIYFPPLRNL